MKTNKEVIVATAVIFAVVIHLFGQTPLQFTDIKTTEEGAIRLSWQSKSNTLYSVQYANELSDQTDWETLTDIYPSHGTNTFFLDTGDYFKTPFVLHPRNLPARFYRILNEGTNGAPPPKVSITSPASGFVAVGNVTITVTASTDQATLLTRLYVDGQEMPPANTSTNFAANGTNYLTDGYVINSCEWLNGTHTLFAVAECASDFAGPVNVAPAQMGHAVSAYVPVTFSNLIAGFSWSEPFFEPSLGQTQMVSAVFAANVNWTLRMLNASSNVVRTVTGSGNSMQFAWDGSGDGGTSLTAGVYHYLLSAQTNGQPSALSSASGSSGASGLLSALLGAKSGAGVSASMKTAYPASIREALAAGLTSYFTEPPPMPPVRVKTKGGWTYVPYEDVYGPQAPVEMTIPVRVQEKFLQSVNLALAQNSSSANSMSSLNSPAALAVRPHSPRWDQPARQLHRWLTLSALSRWAISSTLIHPGRDYWRLVLRCCHRWMASLSHPAIVFK